MNNYSLEIASLSGKQETCEIEFEKGTPIELIVRISSIGTMSFVDENLFGALSKLRLRLEDEGYLLLCNAARRDAYPSRMTLEMSGGRKIYLLHLGAQTRREDLVDALSPATIDQVSNVAEQRIFYENWLRSLE